MSDLANRSTQELSELREQMLREYEALRARGLRLDMTRGKPSPEQLDLSMAMLSLAGNGDITTESGEDARNYGGSSQGLPEARALFANALGAPIDQILVGNNSSLALMHDCIVFALLKGVPGGRASWSEEKPISFLCPVPGYDRHFAICEEYGIQMIPVPLTGEGPDMDVVERLVADPSVKGMWCVPQYSNPTGEIYSDEAVRRLGAMRSGASDFRLFWDNAYAVHHLTDESRKVANIFDACAAGGYPDRPFVFASTSKVTFGGAGLGFFASSPANMRWFVARMSRRTIGPDKLNQLRHVRFLRDSDGVRKLMNQHRALLLPKFDAVAGALATRLDGTGAARWTHPQGGYFITLDMMLGSARRVVELAKEIGLALTPAGATHPLGQDPDDRTLRIAPTNPPLTEVRLAAQAIALCVLLAATEALLTNREMTDAPHSQVSAGRRMKATA
ncbi:MAG: aminotransferase class I/II-fold pyridoxal phosphate-dependent enzyme [Hyphomicrobiales bacterium]|nr:aminotransferase class I/II-fold pyridoxal phosphate-dependent enzyme [Hyphomicrobiales bacterium]